MKALVAGALTIENTRDLVFHWTGKSDDRHPTTILGPYFTEILDAVEPGGVVEMHFEALAHFNSATIAAVIRLIQDARARRVPLVLTFDDHLKWQKLSFDALRIFATDDLLVLRGL